jgi:hypothetical protein
VLQTRTKGLLELRVFEDGMQNANEQLAPEEIENILSAVVDVLGKDGRP